MAYRVFGSSGSPYSIKVRSYCRYKDLDHVWLVRNTPELVQEHSKHSKLPIVPTVVCPDGSALQDSTPIMEALEVKFPQPAAQPPDAALRFLSELLEEFGDEWGNKWMMHFRWYSKGSGPDADAYSRRIAVELRSGSAVGTEGLKEHLAALQNGFKERMLGRGFTVGSNDLTAPIIESSYVHSLVLLEAHLSAPHRPFLFGKTPCFGDFGLSGQLIQMLNDVTGGELMRLHAPHVVQWCERMVNPQSVAGGGFETWDSLGATLQPFLQSQAALFLRWSAANAEAIASSAKELTLDLGDGRVWKQDVGGPQKYHAKSLKELRRKFAAVSAAPRLSEILRSSGCLEPLQGGAGSKL